MNQLNNFFNNKLQKYLPQDKESTQGFFLFNPPTGSGKTTSTIKYIANKINNSSKRKFLFITNLKENLDKPFQDLEKIVESKRILRLLSVQDELCRLSQYNCWKEPKSYRFKSYSEFKESVDIYYENRNSDNSKYKLFLEAEYLKKEKIFKKELFFRIDELKKLKNKIALKALKTEVKKIYRTIDLLDEYDVVFLTTARFLYQIYDPFNGSNYIYNLEKFKDNTICFIDEFDSQKKIFLDIEIDKFIEETKDYISIFLKIYAGLNDKEYFHKFGYEKELEALKEHFSKVYKKNNLQYSHKLNEEPSKTNILFKDIEYFSVDKRFYNLQTDIENESNIIVKKETNDFDKEKGKSLGLLKTLNDIIVSINYFTSRVYGASLKYHKEHENRLEFSNAISTVLHEVNISKNDSIHYFLKNRILEKNRINHDDYYSDWSKNVFYDKGFRYFSFHNSLDSDTKTTIDFKVFENTPEKILTQIAQNSFIVGISATALNKSVTSNFKLEYLKSKFMDNYFHLNEEELKELKELYIDVKKDKLENYEVEIIDCNYTEKYDLKKRSKKLFGDNLEDWIELHENIYYINRYFKIVEAYLAFKKNDNIQSFLCLLTTYPKQESDEYSSGINKEHLDKLIKMALLKNDIEMKNDEELYFIYDSKALQEYEDIVKAKLKNDEKIFVISVYQSIGIGKNIQYKIIKNGKEVEKDFDAIYLDKPTFLMERLNGQDSEILNEKKLITYIYQLETLFNDLQIDRRELKESIQNGFNTTFNQSTFKPRFSHSATEDYLYSASKVIIQAVGRLHRTRESSKKFIFIDKDLEFLSSYHDKNSFTLLSFEALLIKVRASVKNHDSRDTIDKVVNIKNFHVRSKIEDILNLGDSYKNNKNIQRIKEWQEIREFVLKNPTLKEISSKIYDRYAHFYFEIKRRKFQGGLTYFYKEYYDYKDIEIFWERKSESIEVSAKNAKLDLIRGNSYLKEKFEENGYALNFSDTSFFRMIPIVYNNIYKGALGEKVGKFLLEQDSTIELLDLDEEEFEKFDYKIENGVYIDFKYFGENTGTNIDVDELIEKSKYKLNEVNGKKAIIINCFACEKYVTKEIRVDNVLVYPLIIDTKSNIQYEIIKEIREEIRNADK